MSDTLTSERHCTGAGLGEIFSTAGIRQGEAAVCCDLNRSVAAESREAGEREIVVARNHIITDTTGAVRVAETAIEGDGV